MLTKMTLYNNKKIKELKEHYTDTYKYSYSKDKNGKTYHEFMASPSFFIFCGFIKD